MPTEKLGLPGIYLVFWGKALKEKPEYHIIYNTENLGFKHYKYIEYFKDAIEVWDYSPMNNFYYDTKYVPLEMWPAKIPEMEKTIDILFYGLMSERRIKIIADVKNRGVDVHCPNENKKFGDGNGNWMIEDNKLNKLIASSKIILSIGMLDYSLNDSCRIIPALSKGAKVVVEYSNERLVDETFKKHGAIMCETDELANVLKQELCKL